MKANLSLTLLVAGTLALAAAWAGCAGDHSPGKARTAGQDCPQANSELRQEDDTRPGVGHWLLLRLAAFRDSSQIAELVDVDRCSGEPWDKLVFVSVLATEQEVDAALPDENRPMRCVVRLCSLVADTNGVSSFLVFRDHRITFHGRLPGFHLAEPSLLVIKRGDGARLRLQRKHSERCEVWKPGDIIVVSGVLREGAKSRHLQEED